MDSVQTESLKQTEGAIVRLVIPHGGIRVERPYMLDTHIREYSERYGKWLGVDPGFTSDGATGAIDIKGSTAWLVHDYLCDHGTFYDGTPCTNWQASRIVTDLLARDGYGFRRFSWFWPTWLFGGGKCREKMW